MELIERAIAIARHVSAAADEYKCDEAFAELAQLRKDSERYRWLRNCETSGRFLGPALVYLDVGSDEFDAAIDAAMKSHNAGIEAPL